MTDKKDSRKKWWNDDSKFSLFFLAIGVIMGVVSYAINSPLRSFLLSLVVFIVISIAVKKVWKISENKGWWFSKFVIFIFVWFLAWTIFHTSCSIYNIWCL